jgi:lipopolysaccharide biosynthesis glycosyltransferase
MVEVVVTADDSYADPVIVTLYSMALADPQVKVRATILHRGLLDSTVERIKTALPSSIEPEFARVDHLTALGLSEQHLPLESYLRLAAPDVVRGERAVYIDCDTLVLRSILELWEVDLSGLPLGAARNLGSPFFGSPLAIPDWERRGLDPTLPYFNAGVLVLDLGKWRELNISDEVVRQALRHPTKHSNDQVPLNVVLSGRWAELDTRWNQHPTVYGGSHAAGVIGAESFAATRDDPWIVHFLGRRKPWQTGCTHPLTGEWRKVARQVFGRDWSPIRPPVARRFHLAGANLKVGARAALSAFRDG